MAANTDCIIKRATTYEQAISATDSSGVPIDLTGWKIRFMGKRDINDSDANAIIDITISMFTNPTSGITSFSIPDETTATFPIGNDFVYAYKVFDTAGNSAESDPGLLIIEPAVIQATS